MKRKTVRVGIMPYEDYKKRTIAIAKEEYKPTPNEPTIWFNSIDTMAKVLSQKNQDLLKVITYQNPDSITALSKITGRAKSNLSRTLKTMEGYGLIELVKEKRNIRPVVKASGIRLDIQFTRLAD